MSSHSSNTNNDIKNTYSLINKTALSFVRASLPFAELALIGWIIYFVFNSDGIGKEMQNILSACVGGLLVNYTKMSGFIFSRESDDRD